MQKMDNDQSKEFHLQLDSSDHIEFWIFWIHDPSILFGKGLKNSTTEKQIYSFRHIFLRDNAFDLENES